VIKAIYDSGCQICCIGSDSSSVLIASTPKYHVADKHDSLPSHFKRTLGQLAVH